jgi:membrane protein DedA with SNARE-associated domain
MNSTLIQLIVAAVIGMYIGYWIGRAHEMRIQDKEDLKQMEEDTNERL